mgnify:CR=1 FL=1
MIKDSGTRREFATGAVRDIQEGKGRCDLLPLDAFSDVVLISIENFKLSADYNNLRVALNNCDFFPDFATMLLEVSKHFEEGAKKYGEDNWQKGIPAHCYIDSAVRHYLKHRRGDTDEPHDRAFVWNLLCCIWTCIHKPELNDYRGDDAPVVAEVHIKSEELCKSCEYEPIRHCRDKMNRSCTGCPLNLGRDCFCLTIKVGEPCKYFKPFKEETK